MTRNALTDSKNLNLYEKQKYPSKMQSFMNLGRKSFFNFMKSLCQNGAKWSMCHSYLKLIVTVFLTGTVFNISALLTICSFS